MAVGGDGLFGRAGHGLGRHDHVDGEQELAGARRGRVERLAGHVELVGLDQRRAHLPALLLEEGEAHGAADEHRIGLGEHALDDADLVGDLDAAEHDDEGPRRLGEQTAQDLELLGHEEAGHGRQVVRDALGGGVGAVGAAEGVVHVHIGESGQPACELGVVVGLLLVEAQVLEKEHAPRRQLRRGRLDLGPHAVAHGANLTPEQLGETLRHRREAQLLDDLALGAPEMGTEDHRAAAFEEVGDGRQGGADARVVGDAALLQGHVEVDAHQDALAFHRVVADGPFGHGCRLPSPRAAGGRSSSTRTRPPPSRRRAGGRRALTGAPAPSSLATATLLYRTRMARSTRRHE